MYHVVTVLSPKFYHMMVCSYWMEFMLLVGNSLRGSIKINQKFKVQNVIKINLGCKLKSSSTMRAIVSFSLVIIIYFCIGSYWSCVNIFVLKFYLPCLYFTKIYLHYSINNVIQILYVVRIVRLSTFLLLIMCKWYTHCVYIIFFKKKFFQFFMCT